MTKTTSGTTTLLKYGFGQTFIGADFYFIEPDLTFHSIRNSLPVLNLESKESVPLSNATDNGQTSPMLMCSIAANTRQKDRPNTRTASARD